MMVSLIETFGSLSVENETPIRTIEEVIENDFEISQEKIYEVRRFSSTVFHRTDPFLRNRYNIVLSDTSDLLYCERRPYFLLSCINDKNKNFATKANQFFEIMESKIDIPTVIKSLYKAKNLKNLKLTKKSVFRQII